MKRGNWSDEPSYYVDVKDCDMKIFRGLEKGGNIGDNQGNISLEYWTPSRSLAEIYANPPRIENGRPVTPTDGTILEREINLNDFSIIEMECYETETLQKIPAGIEMVIGIDPFTGEISEIIFRR